MFAYRESLGPVDLAFTDRIGGVSAAPFDELNLAVATPDRAVDPRVPENIALVRSAFGPDDTWIHLRQVHGSHVHLAEPSLPAVDPSVSAVDPSVSAVDPSVSAVDPSVSAALPAADGVITTASGLTLTVRAADCVPVLLAAPEAGVIGAAHAGRLGMVAGVVVETVRAMRAHGADRIEAWIGPYVCGACYEVPSDMRDEVVAQVPAANAETSWGTPALDLGAGLRSQLLDAGVLVHDVSRCTRESPDLYSYRRDGVAAGRHAGLIRIRS